MENSLDRPKGVQVQIKANGEGSISLTVYGKGKMEIYQKILRLFKGE